MPTATTDDQEIETTDSPFSTEINDFDDNVRPSDLVEPENALPAISLAELPEASQAAAASAGWTRLMPVQAKAIPYLFAGRDLMVQSRTGSGKTGAFLLPILHRINREKRACQALILVPTRELALQVSKGGRASGEGSRRQQRCGLRRRGIRPSNFSSA